LESQKQSVLTVRLDTYILPSLIIKVIKSMKKNGVIECTSTCLEKLQTNFPNDYFDQYKIMKEGDSVKFTITLLDSTHPEYFYKMKVTDKLDHIKRLKETGGKFFKSSLSNKYKKAADLY